MEAHGRTAETNRPADRTEAQMGTATQPVPRRHDSVGKRCYCAMSDQTEELTKIAGIAASKVYQRYRDYVTREDLVQEALLWLLEHPHRVERAVLADGSRAISQVVKELTAPLVRYAKAEQDAAIGPVEEAQEFYTSEWIEYVLPGVFDRWFRPHAVESGDLSEDLWSAMVADLEKAVNAVSTNEDRRVLFARSVGGWSWQRFSDEYGQSRTTWQRRYRAAMARLAEWLN